MYKIILFFFLSTQLFGQTSIDDNFAFQTDPAKKYSLYIPSAYDENTPNQLMLGLHPFNVNRWDAIAWRDTLINFAEMNNLILVCPDGGIDGSIGDPIDTAFTTALLDSMNLWYNIDEEEVFAMGFSRGGETVYRYGLSHINRFKGFIPIGSAMNGISAVSSIVENAKDVPFYLVHGTLDSPNSRYTPIRNALIDNDACVANNLMTGVGHTIDFPNRNQILTAAFNWVDSVSCGEVVSSINEQVVDQNQFSIYPNPLSNAATLQLNYTIREAKIYLIKIVDITGQVIGVQKEHLEVGENSIRLDEFEAVNGVYFLHLSTEDKSQELTLKFSIVN